MNLRAETSWLYSELLWAKAETWKQRLRHAIALQFVWTCGIFSLVGRTPNLRLCSILLTLKKLNWRVCLEFKRLLNRSSVINIFTLTNSTLKKYQRLVKLVTCLARVFLYYLATMFTITDIENLRWRVYLDF